MNIKRKNFSLLQSDIDNLTEIKERLGLRADTEALRYLIKHFLDHEGRDPTTKGVIQ